MQKFIKQNKLISLVIAAGIIAVLFLYLPSGPIPTVHTQTETIQPMPVEEASGSVDDEANVHFPRYIGTDKDPFIPGVATDNPQPGGPGSLINGGKWDLTGIESINGTTSALVENSTTNQSVFLQVGDKWGGMRVASISDDAVNFINPLGKVTQLGFPAPPAPPVSQGALPYAAGNGYAGFGGYTPSVNQITPLPPLNPDAVGPSSGGFGRFRRQQSN